MRLGAELQEAGAMVGGNRLQPTDTATTVRNVAGAQSLHDGPYAETREQLAGYYLVEAPDLDAAIAWAKKIPGGPELCRRGPTDPAACRPMSRDAAERVLDETVREAGDRIRAALAMRFRDLDMAEEAFAFASLRAVETWSRDGPPRDPAAWLYAVGRRRAFDLGRRAKVRSDAVHDAPEPTPDPETILMAAFEPIPDERLRLIFVCCHPALAPEARIALTLRTLCGLSVERIARAWLTTEVAMLQRLTRAKRKIRDAAHPLRDPRARRLARAAGRRAGHAGDRLRPGL